jgi:hypothetical protein
MGTPQRRDSDPLVRGRRVGLWRVAVGLPGFVCRAAGWTVWCRPWYCRVVSGRLNVRMPPALHEQLAARAAEQGVSLNQLIVSLLAGGIGFTLDP